MKSIIRSFVFVYISITIVQGFLQGYSLDSRALLFIILAFTLLDLFAPAILKTVSLPEKGPFVLIINTFLVFVVSFLLSMLIPNFGFVAATTPKLIIFGFMLTSMDLSPLLAAAATALLYSIVLSFLNWLGKCKR